MHLSLKGSMDRQPLTDRLGDKLLAEYGGAAAAYSLRSLSGDQTKVVRVRRSSDNAEKDFTASEMGAALEDWVNTDTLSTARNYTTDSYETFTGASSSGFTASNSSGIAYAGWDINSGTTGDTVKVSFDLSITSGSPKVSFRAAYDNGIRRSNEIEYTSSGSYTATLTAIGNFSFIAFSEGDIPSDFTVSNFKIYPDGYVETWYDQSGNGNDATQTVAANQPKIVDAGTYLGEIKFENGLYVEKTGLSLSGPFSTFSLSNANSQHSGALLKFGTGFSQQYRSDRSILLQYGDTNFSSAGVYTVGEQNVMSLIFDTTGLGYYNGTEVINDATTGATATQFRIGNSSLGLDGDVKEIIIYNSNQSANRTAIEANINNHYSIY